MFNPLKLDLQVGDLVRFTHRSETDGWYYNDHIREGDLAVVTELWFNQTDVTYHKIIQEPFERESYSLRVLTGHFVTACLRMDAYRDYFTKYGPQQTAKWFGLDQIEKVTDPDIIAKYTAEIQKSL